MATKEYLDPQHDWVVLRQLSYEEKTESGILLPQPGSYDSLRAEKYKYVEPDKDIARNSSRVTNRYEVMAVGPGAYVDVADDLHDQVFLRKPMCCKKGDIVIAQEGPAPISCGDDVLHMCHEYLILAIVRKGEDGKEILDPQHDYIFCAQETNLHESASGIILASSDKFKGPKALPDRWRALGVGDGPWALRQEKGKIPGWARRPMAVNINDVFAFEGQGFVVTVAGAPMNVVQNYQVAAIFKAA